MPTKDPLVYVMHIRDCCRRIAQYTATGGADWPASALIMDALCRNITIIGEAARRLDEPFRRAHPEIPWSSLLGARNIVMHDYEYLQPQLIREMAEKDVLELLAPRIRAQADRRSGRRQHSTGGMECIAGAIIRSKILRLRLNCPDQVPHGSSARAKMKVGPC